MIELEGDKKPKRSIFEQVNDRLKLNTGKDQDEITIQDIATHLGVGLDDLYKWVNEDGEFRDGLNRYSTLQDIGTFNDEEFGNRADAMVIAMLLLETKKKNKPK